MKKRAELSNETSILSCYSYANLRFIRQDFRGYIMQLKIFQVGEPVLRQVARKLTTEEIKSAKIQHLLELMHATVDGTGVGLAAPQIGKALQIAVIQDKPEYTQNVPAEQLELRERAPVPFHVIINPKITLHNAEITEFYEGCLSCAGLISLVPRALEVTVECLNEKAEPVTINARGWYARILQHEIDHLNGILCIDHAISRSTMTIENYTKYWKDKSVAEVRELLNLPPLNS